LFRWSSHPDRYLAVFAGKLEITGDLESPAVPVEAWKVLK
jgi:hypothetical protein